MYLKALYEKERLGEKETVLCNTFCGGSYITVKIIEYFEE